MPQTLSAMARPLVIVESPAKARTIAGFLGDDFTVESSVGHIRDLPTKSELPAEFKGEPWDYLAIDVYNGFKPVYVIHNDKKGKVRELKQLLKQADELYLATDEDREGEAIAWHLLEVLNPPASMPVKRMVFHEITPSRRSSTPSTIPARSTAVWSTPRRPVACSIGSTATSVGHGCRQKVMSSGRRPGAERRHPHRRRPRARAHGVRLGRLLGPRTVSSEPVPDPGPTTDPSPRRSCSSTALAWPPARISARRVRSPSRRRRCSTRPAAVVLATNCAGGPSRCAASSAGPIAAGRPRRSSRRRFQQEAGRKLRLSASMAMRSAQSLYENGLHHLHAHRQHDAVGDGAHGCARRDHPALRRPVPARRAPPVRQEGQERAGGPRGDPPRRRLVPLARARWPARSTPTTPRSTS